MAKIFLIEDDQMIIATVKETLEKWNYQVASVKDWQNVDHEALNFAPDLILMDITLPTFDGFYWTQKIRTFTKTPILFVSGGELDPNAVMALALGADDYIVKPFSLNVLLAKIKVLLKRYAPNENLEQILVFEDYQLNLLTNTLTRQQQSLRLTPTEALIIRLLFNANGQMVTKEKIMQVLWAGNEFIDENALNVNLSRLRAKLSSLDLGQRLITERKRGYRIAKKDE